MPLPTPLITSTAERLGGTPVFAGSRVPVQALLDYLEGGDSLDDFLMDFPSVTREHAVAVLEAARLTGAALGVRLPLGARPPC